jgi:hypothetical protein
LEIREWKKCEFEIRARERREKGGIAMGMGWNIEVIRLLI